MAQLIFLVCKLIMAIDQKERKTLLDHHIW